MNSSNDGKILRLRARYQWAGPGMFWAVIEALYGNGGEMDADALRTFCVCNAMPEDFVQACIDCGLLVEEQGLIRSMRLMEELKNRREKSNKAKKSASIRWQKEAKSKTMRTHSERNANVTLERRGEEKRLQEKPKEEAQSERTPDELHAEFKRVAVSNQWCDEHYADKTLDQARGLAAKDRDEFLRKVRIMLNSALHERTRGLARKVFHEIAGLVNDRGAMQSKLTPQEKAARELFREEVGQTVDEA